MTNLGFLSAFWQAMFRARHSRQKHDHIIVEFEAAPTALPRPAPFWLVRRVKKIADELRSGAMS